MKLKDFISKLQEIQRHNANVDLEVVVMDCSYNMTHILDVSYDAKYVLVGSDDGNTVDGNDDEG